MTDGGDEDVEEKPIGELFGKLIDDGKAYAKAELGLAKATAEAKANAAKKPALLGGAALLFLIGTNVQSGWLFVLSALLLGAAVGGMALPTLMLRGVEVTRSAPLEATQGSPARVRLEVANTSRGMRWMLLLEDEHLSPARMFVASLAPGERIALEGERIAGPRGTCGPSRVVVSSTAPFGVGRARIVLEPDGTTTVLPAWTRLDDRGVRSSAPATGLARRRSKKAGSSDSSGQ